MLEKIVYAGVGAPCISGSAANPVRRLAELPSRPNKWNGYVGGSVGERVAERDEAVKAFQELPLAERKAAPAGVTAPAVAVVGCDGGRLQILDRSGSKVEAEEASDADEDGSTSRGGIGVKTRSVC